MKKIQKTQISKPNILLQTKILAVVKEIPEEINPISKTQLQPEDTEDSLISTRGDIQDVAWIDAENNPWKHGMHLECIHNI